MPVSTLAGLVTLVAVSPRMPGGASRTLRVDGGREFEFGNFAFDFGQGCSADSR